MFIDKLDINSIDSVLFVAYLVKRLTVSAKWAEELVPWFMVSSRI